MNTLRKKPAAGLIEAGSAMAWFFPTYEEPLPILPPRRYSFEAILLKVDMEKTIDECLVILMNMTGT